MVYDLDCQMMHRKWQSVVDHSCVQLLFILTYIDIDSLATHVLINDNSLYPPHNNGVLYHDFTMDHIMIS